MISGYTQRASTKTGNVQDDYVFSVIFNRDKFKDLNCKNIDPIEAIKSFENKVSLSSIYEMKNIEPFTLENSKL